MQHQSPFKRSGMSVLRLCTAICLLACTSARAAPVSVLDDTGAQVRLPAHAQRIVSLAPHATELLFAAGAGASVIAATAYSDYPPAAAKLPRVGGYHALDLERIVALKPDLVVGWASGNPAAQLDRIRALGIPVYLSEPREFETIASNLERLGVLAGSSDAARRAALTLRTGLADLRSRYAGRTPVKVFYQVWSDPLQTLNGKHMVSGVLKLCGGQNVFDGLAPIAPTVTHEAVLAAAPEAILTGREPDTDKGSLEAWKRWPQLPAVRFQNLIYVSGDELNRPGPRILAGANEVCRALDEARARIKPPR